MGDSRKVVIFTLLLLAIVGILFLLVYGIIAHNGFIIASVLSLLAALYIMTKTDTLLRLKEYERAVVFRFGRFVGVRGPGWVVVVPFIETYVKVDLRVQTFDVPPQKVITRDNIEITVDAVIALKIIDPKKAVLNVKDFKEAALLFVKSELREVIGNMTLQEVIANVDKINARLKEGLQSIAKDWGIEVVDVGVKEIRLPPDLLEAMHKRREAEQMKEAMRQKAEAEKIKIEAVKEAAEGLSDKAIAYYYIKALEQIAAGKATKIVLPLEVSQLAAMIAKHIGGGVSQQQIEQDLLSKYKHLVDAYLKGLEQKSRRKRRK